MMEFLEFISRSPGHFIGFLIVFGGIGSFIINVLIEIRKIINNKQK